MRPLGQLLLERGLIEERDLDQARAIQRERGARLGPTLLRIGAVSEDALLSVLSEQVGLPVLSGAELPGVDQVREAISTLAVSPTWLVSNEVVIWRASEPGNADIVCAAGPHLHDPDLQEALEQLGAPALRLFLVGSAAIDPILIGLQAASAGLSGPDGADAAKLIELAEEAPVIDLVNSILAEALALRASDIHFEPFEDRILVRLRIDGVLSLRRTAAKGIFDAISSRIKLLSGMDIAERRLPQDGRQRIRVSGRELDVRVSTLPTTWGESIVVRILGNTRLLPSMDDLGLDASQESLLRATIRAPNGLVLVTGPTGSGKTTTVYRLISELNDGVRKIVTIEDPVEFDLPGVLQMPVRSDISLDFATGLRSILRQDPDVIFVGEIRDAATATTAIQAALTGHLVISTVHTNSALASLPRLIDLGVERFLLADVLRAVVGQRLLRKLCPACAVLAPHSDDEERALALLPANLRRDPPAWRSAPGCGACGGTGFQGRMGVFEVAGVDAGLQHAIRSDAGEPHLVELARRQGFTTLFENGVAAARAGRTTFAEALRVLGVPE